MKLKQNFRVYFEAGLFGWLWVPPPSGRLRRPGVVRPPPFADRRRRVVGGPPPNHSDPPVLKLPH